MLQQSQQFGRKWLAKGPILGTISGPKIFQNRCTNRCRKHCEMMPKGYQNGIKNDPQYNQQSMLKPVAKQTMKIIKNHVSLMCKNMQVRFLNNGF